MSELEPWRANLIVTGTGAPKPLLANAITARREAPAWRGVLAYDQFALETVVTDAPPWHMGLQWATRAWSPHDDLLAAEWLQRSGIFVNTATAAQAVEAVARERSFHPVIDYLSDLQHDGVARSGTWLSTCLGAEQSRYNESVGRAMLIAAVARIHDPGCKVDTVPIFEGVQGARKSTAVKALFDLGSATSLQTSGPKMRRCRPEASGASKFPSLMLCPGWKFHGSNPLSREPLIGSGRHMVAELSKARVLVFSGVRPIQTAT
jgi:hypothetical protein